MALPSLSGQWRCSSRALLLFCALWWGLLEVAMLDTGPTWTFDTPGASYMDFLPQYSDGQDQHFVLTFRTKRPNGLLLFHHLAPFDSKKFPLLLNYALYAEIRQGYLRVGHQFNQHDDDVTLGKGLNDDQWHAVDVVLNTKNSNLSVTLDNETRWLDLQAYRWGNARDVLQWSQIPSIVSYGALKVPGARDYFHFIGCLRGLQYQSGEDGLVTPTFRMVLNVSEGCNDLCATANPCRNGGVCINDYTGIRCDCFGLDFEGPHCENQEPVSMTFRGYEYITYKLYEGMDNRLVSDRNRMAFEFKTRRGSGVLMYAVGTTPSYSHVTASVHSGALHVSLSFGENDLEFKMGIGLDNDLSDRWHNLTIVHDRNAVDVYLDGDVHSKTVEGPQHFISLDPYVYFGGGDNFIETRGLQVTQKFVGCLRNVYFHDVSVLYRLHANHSTTSYHGGAAPLFGCQKVDEVPITFPTPASMLRYDMRLNERSDTLDVSFRFRTVRETAVIFYIELISLDRLTGSIEYGYIEIWLKEGQPVLHFVPTMRLSNYTEDHSLPSIVSNSQWHTVRLRLENSQARLEVDGKEKRTSVYRKTLVHRGDVVLGYGLRKYKASQGFVGCMAEVKVAGTKLDAIAVMETDAAIGLRLDGCHLVDYCQLDNFCQHGSRCLSDWDGVFCDCPDDYVGKACHFPKYLASCDAYYQVGMRDSGVYLLDVDGSGPLGATYARCHMGAHHGDVAYGETIVAHNLAPNTTVRGPGLPEMHFTLQYREMDRRHLRALTERSGHCQQHLKYDCRQSPIQLSSKTWFKAASGEIVTYIGSKKGQCDCSPHETCGGKHCNCDHGAPEHRRDHGMNTVRRQLPITEVVIIPLTEEDGPPQWRQGSANLTIGPLKCWGNEKQELEKPVTFTQQSAFIKVHGWTSGELRFSFKTHKANIMLLYQSPDKTNPNFFTIFLLSATVIEFHFFVGGQDIWKRVSTLQRLDEGAWHAVRVEHDPHDLRLSVDQGRELLPLPQGVSRLSDFKGVLYVGGTPEGYMDEFGATVEGFTGCMRGFVYNGNGVDLSGLVDGTMTGVSKDCMSSCWPNPCQNGGECLEQWGSYQCLCLDRWAHYGPNCEQDINTDAVTLSGEPSSYLQFNMSAHPEILNETIVLGFRTLRQSGLLIYAHDHNNNFVQLDLLYGNTIRIMFNDFDDIIQEYLTVEEGLSDGQWKQLIAEDFYNHTKLHVQKKHKIIQRMRHKLISYSTNPFPKATEYVYPSRPLSPPPPFVSLYVGGVTPNTSTIPSLRGCIRGLRIGSVTVHMAQHVERLNSTDITAACESGCGPTTCRNSGYCNEYWGHGNFSCDCTDSFFSGLYCQIEPSAMLDGESLVKHQFTLPVSYQKSTTEQLIFTFRTSVRESRTKPRAKAMLMVVITSSRTNNYILVKLQPSGDVLVETNQGYGIYSMKYEGRFADGRPHEVIYKRDGSNSMYLAVDGLKEEKYFQPDYSLNDMDTIYMGGIVSDLDAYTETINFTGCISNVIFIPKTNFGERILPLKEYHNGNPQSSFVGNNVTSCSALPTTPPPSTTPVPELPSVTDIFKVASLPPWQVDPATGYTSLPTPAPTTPTTPPRPTLPVTPRTNITAPVLRGNSADDITIAISVSIIAILLIIALIIAVLLVRQKRRHGDYAMKKEADMELKLPLNHYVSAGPSPVPPDHLAKLDEFSMISATLGPRPQKVAVPPATNRYSNSSYPTVDDDQLFANQIYSRKKKRPASSISEVLEEMERRQKARDQGLDPDAETPSSEKQNHGEGELEWDPQADRTPLTCGEITFFNSPLLLSIPDENEENLHDSSASASVEKQEDEAVPSEEAGLHNSVLDGYNGDSGYEAESRPEGTEGEATPDTTIDEDSPLKSFNVYDLPELQSGETFSDPSEKLLSSGEATDT